MRTAFLIARKDLSLRLRDKSAFLYGIVAPLGLAVILSFVFKPVSENTFHADYLVVDHDKGAIAKAFRQALDAMADEGIATVSDAPSWAEAKEQVEAGSSATAAQDAKTADAAFVLPQLMTDDLMSGKGGRMSVIVGEGSGLAGQVAYSLAQGFAAEVGAVELAVQTALPYAASAVPDDASGGSPARAAAERMAGLTQRAAATKSPVTLVDQTAGTKQLDTITYLSAGMAVFFVFFTVAFGVSGLLEERRLGTMQRLLAAPIGRTSIVVGKMISSFALGIVSMGILVVATTVALDAEWGNPLGVAMLVLAVVFAAMGILAVVAAFAKTPDQAGSFQAIISLVLAFLGGTFFSISQVGGFIATLSLITPHAWFLRGLGDLQGGEVSAVVPAVGALLAFGLVTGAIAWPFLRRSVQR